MDLNKIANTPGFGTGRAARDKLADRAEWLGNLPERNRHPLLTATTEMPDLPVAYLGNGNSEGWWLAPRHEAGFAWDDHVFSDAEDSAKAIAAIVNLYFTGELVLKP